MYRLNDDGPPVVRAARRLIQNQSQNLYEPYRTRWQECNSDALLRKAIGQHRKRAVARKPVKLASMLAADTQRIMQRIHGVRIAESDRSVEDLRFLALVMSATKDGERRFRNFVDVNAPWFEDRIADAWIAAGCAKRPSAKAISEHFSLTWAQRCAWGMRNVPAVDVTGEELKHLKAERRKELNRRRMQRARRKAGSVGRKAYCENSLAALRPWEAEGVSRRTWYRTRAKERATKDGTSPCANNRVLMFAHTPVPMGALCRRLAA